MNSRRRAAPRALCAGWAPNPPVLLESTGGGMCWTFWRNLPMPAHGPLAATTYDAQSTFIFDYRWDDGTHTLLWMGDRWNERGPGGVGAASYVGFRRPPAEAASCQLLLPALPLQQCIKRPRSPAHTDCRTDRLPHAAAGVAAAAAARGRPRLRAHLDAELDAAAVQGCRVGCGAAASAVCSGCCRQLRGCWCFLPAFRPAGLNVCMLFTRACGMVRLGGRYSALKRVQKNNR